MYKESWGLKRICPMCSKQYYDLGRIKLECPECEKDVKILESNYKFLNMGFICKKCWINFHEDLLKNIR